MNSNGQFYCLLIQLSVCKHKMALLGYVNVREYPFKENSECASMVTCNGIFTMRCGYCCNCSITRWAVV